MLAGVETQLDDLDGLEQLLNKEGVKLQFPSPY